MSGIITIEVIEPQRIIDAFGSYRMGITQALPGTGNMDDGRFQDVMTDWSQNPASILKASYLAQLVRAAKRGGHNFIEFWGWPEIRYRSDDNKGMVYSRVRFLYVVVQMNTEGRPN